MALPAPYTLTFAIDSEPNPVGPALDPVIELARCFLRLANLPNFALDRLSRYEATLWRQAGKSYMRSIPWIAAIHKKEGAAPMSMIGGNCRPHKLTIVEFGVSSGFRQVGSSNRDRIWLGGPRIIECVQIFTRYSWPL